MQLIYKKLTYKSLVTYSLIILAMLIVAGPVWAMSDSTRTWLDFSRGAAANLSPQAARPLTPGVNVNHLNPGEENWYTFSRASFNPADTAWVSLALRYESEALISPEQANFELRASQPTENWFTGPAAPGDVMGTGLRSPLPTAQSNLTESFWSGQVDETGVYYVRVFNQSPFGLNYSLEAKAETPAFSGAAPVSLNSALDSAEARNTRQLAWTLTAQAVEDMSASDAAEWMRQAQAVGWLVTAGTDRVNAPRPFEADPQLLWRLTAQAIAGQEAEAAARWLIQADSLGWLTIPLNMPKNPFEDVTPTEGGGDDGSGAGGSLEPAPAIPAPPNETYAPINIYPNNPLQFDFLDVNSGRLSPYGEHWYSLQRDDLDKDKIENMALTLFTTPSNGFIDSRVNFEIFPAGQYHIWQRGDADYMENMGLGQWVSRDEDDQTGERLWSGSLVDGDQYLIKVKNSSPAVIDYYLYPGDVENALLGQPKLHQANGLAGQTPYMPAPPTRPGPPPEPGAAPPEAIEIKPGLTSGTLAAGAEIWYKIFYADPHNEDTPQHDFEILLTNTPLDNVRARHADFALYAGNQLALWSRGTLDQMEPFGTSIPSANALKDVRSLQVVWKGQLMEEQVYYVKVWNHDIGPLQYELELKGGP